MEPVPVYIKKILRKKKRKALGYVKPIERLKPEKYSVGKSWSNTTQEGTSRMKRLLANKKKVS
tara:strand:+ start:694 stop:882 length:189 start_codon:yes stop_codon:yes gene_type:complete